MHPFPPAPPATPPTPRFLLGTALLFWGWHAHLLPAAALVAVAVEGAPLLPIRWQFTTQDYQRLWNGSLALLLGSVLFAIGYGRALSETGGGAREGVDLTPVATRQALLFFQWWPLVFAPLLLASIFGRDEHLPSTVFSWVSRRQQRAAELRGDPPTGSLVALKPVYLAMVLICSSTTNRRSAFFYLGLIALVGWGLWPRRSRRVPGAAWLTLLLLGGTMGLAGHLGITELHRFLANLDTSWLNRFSHNRTNPMESRTQLGTLGDLKLSGRIVLRLQTTNENPPELLREATYDSFSTPVWSVGARGEPMRNHLDWKTVLPEDNGTGWILTTNRNERNEIRISEFLSGGNGLLPLPLGAIRLEDLPAGSLRRNAYGGVKVSDASSLVTFRAAYAYHSTMDHPPTERDRFVPVEERAAVDDVIQTLGLRSEGGQPAGQVLKKVNGYFRGNFRYATYQEEPHTKVGKQTPLGHFFWRKSGHCEFFATATVLLLRRAGIPARYAVGYSVQESAGSQHYVVRERHAHAWCLYWSEKDKAWFNFDTTPAAWNQVEADQASMWEPLADLASRLWFEFAQWRAGRSELTKYLAYGLGAILAIFIVRLFIRAKRLGPASAGGGLQGSPGQGLDSEFYELERLLAKSGRARHPEETPAAWILRLRREGGAVDGMEPVVSLHYRLRFGATGLTPPLRDEFRTRVRGCLQRVRGRPPEGG